MFEANKTILLIDASSQNLQTGVLKNNEWVYFQSEKTDVLEGLFRQIKNTLSKANSSLFELDYLFFCEGPGSLLGLRLGAMAIATWKAMPEFTSKIYCYKSLHAAYLLHELEQEKPFAVLSSFKKGHYNLWRKESTEPQLTTNEELQSLKLKTYFLNQRKLKQKKPESCQELKYDLKSFPQIMANKDFLKETTQLDAWVPEQAEYVKWLPQRHSKN